MATLVARVVALIAEIGADVKALFSRSLPPGGNSGQVLRKTSSTDYAAAWATPSGIPAGGTTGQILKKGSSADFDAAWEDEFGGAGGSGTIIAVQAGKPLWRGFVSSTGAVGTANDQGHPSFVQNSGGSVSAFYSDFLTPLKSIAGILTINLPQINSNVYIGMLLGASASGVDLFKRGQAARFQGSIRFGFLGGLTGVFFSGVIGGHPSGPKAGMTGLGVQDLAWTAAVFGSSSGYPGGCAGIGFEPGDVNLQFVRLQQGVNVVKIDSGVTIASVAGATLELTFVLNSGGTSMTFILTNVDAGLILADAIVQLPSIENSTYTIGMGVGNRSSSAGNVKKLAILHMLFANPPGAQPI